MAVLVDQLLRYLFDRQPHLLSQEMSTWLATSRRFSSFVTDSRDKIRKKLRVTKDEETLYDLRLELETAYLLLGERALSLEYEPQLGKQIRSPDFAVTFTTSLTFMVEVTRMRAVGQTATAGENTSSPLSLSDRLADTVCSKLGQCLAGHHNVLIIGTETLQLAPSDLQAAMLRIQQRAERDEDAFWQRYRFRDRSDFFRHYQRLSEILLRGTRLQADQPVITWVNPRAKNPLPGKVRTALLRSHSQDID